MTIRRKALVMGDDTRSFLATVRSLGRKGIEVHAAPYNLRSPALSSRYISKVHRLPYYLNDGADWIAALQKLMAFEQYNFVIPCEERSLLPLFKHQQLLPPGAALAIPSAEALDVFFDKVNTRACATHQGVPVARGKVLEAQDTAESILEKLTLPLVGKSRKSYSWPDLYVRTSVKMLCSCGELAQWITENKTQAGQVFLEEVVTGYGLGLSVLCHHGEVLQAFEHHRAHEQMGSSYYRNSAPIHLGRLEAVKKMVGAVAYTGLAMFEFKHDAGSGKWALLEVNARVWGSLPLPVAIGVDFPYRLYQLMAEGKRTPELAYRTSVYARNLVSDLWQLRAATQQNSQTERATLSAIASWFADLPRLLVGREYHDAWTWDDFKPGVVEIKQLVDDKLLSGSPTKKFKELLSSKQVVELLQEFHKKNRQPAQVVFVCQGNICRSPYAEYKAKQLFADQQEKIAFSSAGMLPRNHRPSPANAVAAAATLGIDLAPHQSRNLTDAILNQVQLIVIFDEINFDYFKSRYPESTKPIALITSFKSIINITVVNDPEGETVEEFINCYKNIDKYLTFSKKAIDEIFLK